MFLSSQYLLFGQSELGLHIELKNQYAPAKLDIDNEDPMIEDWKCYLGGQLLCDKLKPSARIWLSGYYTLDFVITKDNKEIKFSKKLNILSPEKCLVAIMTPWGDMIAELYDDTPLHRDNFIKNINDGVYDNTDFHRVIKDFMIQGGIPNDKNISKKEIINEITKNKYHLKGAIAAARMDDYQNPNKNSDAFQFYIVQGSQVQMNDLENSEKKNNIVYSPEMMHQYLSQGGTPFLDNQYTVFGRVIDGINVVDTIAELETNASDIPMKKVELKVILIK